MNSTDRLARSAERTTRKVALVSATFFSSTLFPQQAARMDLQQAEAVLDRARHEQFTDLEAGLRQLRAAAAAFKAAHRLCEEAWCRVYCSSALDHKGSSDSAVALLLSIDPTAIGPCSAQLRVDHAAHLAGAYLSLNEFHLADSIARRSWSRDVVTDTTLDASALLLNRGFALANLGELDEAYAVFAQAGTMARRHHRSEATMLSAMNMATVQALQGRLDKAAEIYTEALAEARAAGRSDDAVNILGNLAGISKDRGQLLTALAYLDSAEALAHVVNEPQQLADIALGRAQVYTSMGMADSVQANYARHIALRDSLLSKERIKAVADVREKYETEKKARENASLRARNLEVQRTRDIYLFTGIAVVGMALALWNRLRQTRRSRAAIQREKDISEDLLRNILPDEVAQELKDTGEAQARHFDTATILFTDFKGFTQLSEKVSPAELVAELNTCFKAFDGIMGTYLVEKIKTIGDAYMAAGGLPDPQHGPPADVIRAALEMQDFMQQHKARRAAAGKPCFEMRVGIHSGPVVAGIVGVKKFQYDIWGDTVNTASRMESSGEVGRVNISEATYALVKDTPGFAFTPRGKVQAKGKGELEMYFVEAIA